MSLYSDFDWKQYINNYSDLKKANINTREKALEHWINYGKMEGRIYKNIIDNINIIDSSNNIGFIILRHVNSIKTNMYWQECYSCIRKFYPNNKIIIIDDNSNYSFITEILLVNTIIINSEFKGRGELLPYYYYSKNKWFEIAVFLHDSVFINKYIDFNVDKYKMIWDFSSSMDKRTKCETQLINSLTNNIELLLFYKQNIWKGCFGAMTVITYDYLKMLDNKYTLSNLLKLITTRYDRCRFERVIACILQLNYNNISLLGDIIKYCKWGYTFDRYLLEKLKLQLPIIKVWTGR